MSLKQKFQLLGPGLVYAGAAVGVSHLVQSTRAGAQFGAILFVVVILANLFKYPSFEFSSRYVAATGENLLHGYKKLGKWAVILFFFFSFLTMFTIQAAVTIVTAGIVQNLTGFNLGAQWWSLILLAISSVLLYTGQYKYLDKGAKVVIILLSIATLISLALSFGIRSATSGTSLDWTNYQHLAFLVAFIGWMPAPIDVAIWSSLWGVEKNRVENKRATLSEALFDFRVGYLGTAILAIAFVLLGANAFYGSGEVLAANSVQFAEQLISMYTKSLGVWAAPFIALAAFLTMFSTTITCLDAFPRVMRAIAEQLDIVRVETQKRDYIIGLLLVDVVTVIILFFFVKNMRGMVDFATTVAFVTAPILALLNYLAVKHKSFPKEYQLSKSYNSFSLLSLAVLFLFMFGYLYMKVNH